MATAIALDFFSTLEDTSISSNPDENFFSVSEDIIAISCVAKRTGQGIAITENASRLAKSITAEDRLLAQSIRKFYNGKLMVAQLRNESLTPFRKDLLKLLNTPSDDNGQFVYSDKFAGMLYKLPYFYDYDRTLVDSVFGSEYHDIIKPIRRNSKNRATVDLTFIRKTDAFRKRNPQVEYWFTDDYDNRVLLTIEKANPLDALFENYLSSNDVRIEGYFAPAHKDTLNYYTVTHWLPVFD